MFKPMKRMVKIWWRTQWVILHYGLLDIGKADFTFIAYLLRYWYCLIGTAQLAMPHLIQQNLSSLFIIISCDEGLYDPMISLHGCLVVFTGLHWVFIRLNSVTLFDLLGCFPSPCLMLIWSASSGDLHHLRGFITDFNTLSLLSGVCFLGDLVDCILIHSTSSVALNFWRVLVAACQSDQPPLARFLSASLVLSALWGNDFFQEISMASLT